MTLHTLGITMSSWCITEAAGDYHFWATSTYCRWRSELVDYSFCDAAQQNMFCSPTSTENVTIHGVIWKMTSSVTNKSREMIFASSVNQVRWLVSGTHNYFPHWHRQSGVHFKEAPTHLQTRRCFLQLHFISSLQAAETAGCVILTGCQELSSAVQPNPFGMTSRRFGSSLVTQILDWYDALLKCWYSASWNNMEGIHGNVFWSNRKCGIILVNIAELEFGIATYLCWW